MKLIQAAHIFYDYLIRDENDNVMATEPALSDFSLEIEQGSFVCLLGHNGSGKSTFAKLINAMNLAQGDDALELRQWLNDPYALRDQKFPAVRAIYERLGLQQLSRQAIEHYNRQALDALQRIGMADEPRQAFAQLITRLTTRNK